MSKDRKQEGKRYHEPHTARRPSGRQEQREIILPGVEFTIWLLSHRGAELPSGFEEAFAAADYFIPELENSDPATMDFINQAVIGNFPFENPDFVVELSEKNEPFQVALLRMYDRHAKETRNGQRLLLVVDPGDKMERKEQGEQDLQQMFRELREEGRPPMTEDQLLDYLQRYDKNTSLIGADQRAREGKIVDNLGLVVRDVIDKKQQQTKKPVKVFMYLGGSHMAVVERLKQSKEFARDDRSRFKIVPLGDTRSYAQEYYPHDLLLDIFHRDNPTLQLDIRRNTNHRNMVARAMLTDWINAINLFNIDYERLLADREYNNLYGHMLNAFVRELTYEDLKRIFVDNDADRIRYTIIVDTIIPRVQNNDEFAQLFAQASPTIYTVTEQVMHKLANNTEPES